MHYEDRSPVLSIATIIARQSLRCHCSACSVFPSAIRFPHFEISWKGETLSSRPVILSESPALGAVEWGEGPLILASAARGPILRPLPSVLRDPISSFSTSYFL